MAMTRFLAEWIIGDGVDADGIFNPDDTEYSTAEFATQKQAQEHADKHAELGPCPGWNRVMEQQYVPYLYKGVDIGSFETVGTWVEGEYISESYDD